MGRSLSFLSFVFLRRRGCLRARGSYGRLLSGEIRATGWPTLGATVGRCLRGRVSLGRLFPGEILVGFRNLCVQRQTRMSKGKSVSGETLLWGDPSPPGGRQWARCREVDLESFAGSDV